jgi:VWFA-related protein
VVVFATDGQGHALKGLEVSNFAASVDGQSVALLNLKPTTADDRPNAIVFALDVSKSMASGHALKSARIAADAFIDELTTQDHVCLVAFGSSVKRLLEFTSQKAQAHKILASLEPRDDKTLLYEGLLVAADEATLAATGKVTVIALTDGKDEGSAVTLEDAVRRAQANHVAIYTLGFGPHADHKTLERISKLTGGQYHYAMKAEDLPALYDSVQQQLKDGYALEVASSPLRSYSDVVLPAPLRSGSHVLSVKLTYRGEEATAKKGFAIPPPPLPRWLRMLIGILGGVLILMALLSLAIVRSKKRGQTIVEPVIPSTWLEIVAGPQRGRRLRIEGRSLRIGKGEGCQLWLAGDSQLAPDHAEILSSSEGSCSLKDLGSKEGTLLNGNRLRPHQSVRLRGGDRVTVGSTVFIFVDQRQGTSRVSPRVDREVPVGL